MAIISPPSITKFSGAIINGLGDSETGLSCQYQQPDTVYNAPQWLPNTAYTLNQCVKNNGLPYYVTTAGTSASSGGPSGTATAITDNTITWHYLYAQTSKQNNSYLSWAERWSLGALNFDMSQGYAGFVTSCIKLIVKNGGSNYTAPTASFSGTSGVTATVQTSNGVVTGLTITNPGFNVVMPLVVTISDATGSGATVTAVCYGSGTFGLTGGQTDDMVAMLPDCLASNVDIFCVYGGTNDCANNGTFTSITTNLRTCYETLIAAGRKVVAIPLTPRTGLTNPQMTVMMRVNRWIRAYCRKEKWANPLGTTNIALADCTPYLTDGANASNNPIGGAGGSANAMTVDGLHPSPRGAMYMGLAVWNAIQNYYGLQPLTYARAASRFDGYDAVFNPGGNMLEGLPWQASTAYTYIGQRVSNGGNQYRLKTVGISASSGGPTGTGSTIADGTCVWAFLFPSGLSVFGSGTGGTNTAATGITFVGNLANSYTLSRRTGTASGTITEVIESPWSNGQAGQRQSIQFALGTGTSGEQWGLQVFNGGYNGFGVQASDLSVNSFYAECELEISGVANLLGISLHAPFDSVTNGMTNSDGLNSTNATGWQMMASSGEMLPLPNSGKYLLRTQPILLPASLTNFNLELLFNLDASGIAGSATAVVKLNYLGMHRAGVA